MEQAAWERSGTPASQSVYNLSGTMEKLAQRLRKHVEYLAGTLGERNPLQFDNLERARDHIEATLWDIGYALDQDIYNIEGQIYQNIIAERPGLERPEQTLVIGAHYDTVPGTPGADDNASGVASLLEIARLLYPREPRVTIRFVAFTLEEPPHFRTPSMGSTVHATACKERNDNILGMLSLEMVGYYCEEKNSQTYPLPLMRWFYPKQGDFIAVAGNFRSRRLVAEVTSGLRASCELPVESAALPFVPGVGLSDNWSFWQQGYSAAMITDTSFFRNPNYHLASDVPESLDYRRMAALTSGLAKVLLKINPGR